MGKVICYNSIGENAVTLVPLSFDFLPLAFIHTYCLFLQVHECRFEKFTICLASYKLQYPGNFAFLTIRILELISHEVCIFLKKEATF